MAEWETSISSSGKDSEVRGVNRQEVMEMDFADAIWLTLTGRKPSSEESEIFNCILSSCIDHGIGNPSTVTSRTVESGGNSANASIAAGILAMGDKHGGAIEGCMKMLQSERSPRKIVSQRLSKEKKIPGIGHKVYKDKDPRAQKIFSKADELRGESDGVNKIKSVKQELGEKKTDLPINVDGAVAAVMSDLGWNPELGKGLFVISRTPGIVAHVEEERKEEDFRRQDGIYTHTDEER
jgi:citryl-CoA lyase